MSLSKKIFLYFPILLGVSMILSIPVAIIFTHTQYGSDGWGMFGNFVDYFFNGTKLVGLFFMWSLAVLLELPVILAMVFPLAIVFVKFKFGYFTTMEIIFCILGAISALVVSHMKKQGRFNWFNNKNEQITNPSADNKNYIPKVVSNFSIMAGIVCLTFFLSYYTGHYILNHLNEYFTYVPGGFDIGPDKSMMEYINGIPITYAFFVGLLFTLFGNKKSWNSYLVALIPALLLSLMGGSVWFLWTIAFFAIGFLIAKSLDKISTAETRRKATGYIAVAIILASGVYAFNYYVNRGVLKSVNYQCAATAKFNVKFYDNYVMLTRFNDNPIKLTHVSSPNSWTKYVSDNEIMTFWVNGDKSYVTENGQKDPFVEFRDCVAK